MRSLVALLLMLPSLAYAGTNLRPQVRSSELYGEMFTFVSDLDDGTYVLLQLAVTNLGPGSANGLCRALVVRPGQKPWTDDIRVGHDDWHWTGGPEEKLSVGTCS